MTARAPVFDAQPARERRGRAPNRRLVRSPPVSCGRGWRRGDGPWPRLPAPPTTHRPPGRRKAWLVKSSAAAARAPQDQGVQEAVGTQLGSGVLVARAPCTSGPAAVVSTASAGRGLLATLGRRLLPRGCSSPALLLARGLGRLAAVARICGVCVSGQCGPSLGILCVGQCGPSLGSLCLGQYGPCLRSLCLWPV